MKKPILFSLAACFLVTEAAVLTKHHIATVVDRRDLGKPIVPLYRQASEAQLSGLSDEDLPETDMWEYDDAVGEKVVDDLAEIIPDPIFNPACGVLNSNGQECGVDAYHVCNMTEVGQWGCGRANITGYDRVNIVTGGETKCLNSSVDYFFQVLQGDPTKLFIWFQGGGACWSNNIKAAGACASYPGGPDYSFFVNPNPVTNTGGFFNRRKSNLTLVPSDDEIDSDISDVPFDDFTIVQLPYCTGDLHVGNTVRTYLNETTGEVVAEAPQVGAKNTEAVLSWVFANYPNITKLVVGGCSAGSIGAQMWSGYIYENYRNISGENMPKMAVIPDGYAGVFPEIQRQLIKDYNASAGAWANVLPEDYRLKMNEGSFFLCEATNYLQDMMPNTTYAAPQGGYDAVQRGFFNVLASISNKSYAHDVDTPQCARESVPVFTGVSHLLPFYLDRKDFFKATQTMYEGYMNRGIDNFYPFFVNTKQHCFLTHSNIRKMSVVDFITGHNITLVDWLDDIPSLESDVDDMNDDSEDFYRVCEQGLPCNTAIFNSSVIPLDS